jgi:hypothetical protein
VDYVTYRFLGLSSLVPVAGSIRFALVYALSMSMSIL